MKKYLLLLLLIVLVVLQKTNAQTPVAYYPFTGNANDAVGSNNGTVNGAALTTDRFGNANSAYSFDGVNDFIGTAALALAQTDNWTMMAWVKPASLSQVGIIVLNGFNNGSTGNGYAMAMSDGTGALGNGLSGLHSAVAWHNSGGVFSTNNIWYHVAMIRESGIVKYYINGVQTGNTTTNGIVTPSGTLRIGSLNGFLFWNGAIDEVKIFNTALTAAQVQQQYNPNNYSSQFNNSVKMNGANDQIELGSTYTQQIFTVEMWVKPGSTQVQYANIIDNNHTGTTNWVCQQNASNANLYGFGVNTNGVSAGVEFQLQPNVWQHIALIRSATVVQVYVNGVLIQSTNISGTNIFSGQFLRLGNWGGGGRNWNGTMDEVRYWGIARTQAEIVANMNTQLTGSEAGLVGYWDMNRNGQGAGLTVDNKCVATGAALNGTTVGTASTPIFEPAVAQQKPGSGNAISFDGVDDVVVVPHIAALNFPADLTVETWIKIPSGALGGSIIEKWGGNNLSIGYPFVLRFIQSVHSITFARYNGASSVSINGISIVDDNKWHHVSATKIGSLLSLYIDGILQGTVTDYTDLTNVNNTQNLGIGYGGAPFTDHLLGSIDEVRIWNTGLTHTQIRDRMCRKITSSDALYPNLVAYYNFDESTGTTAFDATANNNNGILTNSPTRLTSGAAIGTSSSHDYVNATKTTSLTHASGESFTVTSSAGNPDGIHVYRVDEKPNTLTGTTGVGANDKYFGVFQVNGTAPQYTAVYNYNGNPNVNVGNESQLRLNKRSDNAANSWTTIAAIPNEPVNTITVAGESTEYILGTIGTPLPLNLISFSGSKQNNDALLQWKTVNEINVSRFEVQRSTTGQIFENIGTLAAGGSLYSFTDANTFSTRTVAFYRLKSIDVDGRLTYSSIIKLSKQASAAVTVYPNPVSDVLTISGLKQNGTITLFNQEGKLLQQQTISAQTMTMDMSKCAKGMYLLQYKTEDEVVNQKIIKQ
jgi:Concanavalin A-like lectin/glucanases superfamily/Secretion system C-terminal sorting domain